MIIGAIDGGVLLKHGLPLVVRSPSYLPRAGRTKTDRPDGCAESGIAAGLRETIKDLSEARVGCAPPSGPSILSQTRKYR